MGSSDNHKKITYKKKQSKVILFHDYQAWMMKINAVVID